MAKITDIFDRLREYEVQPPPEAFHNLMGRLQEEAARDNDSKWQGALQGLQQLEIQPPSFLSVTIAHAIAQKPLFAALQEMAIEPPAGAFDRIIKAITAESKTQVTTAPIRKLFTRYRAIAVILVLVIAGWGIYRLTSQAPGETPAKLVQKTTPGKPAATDTVQQAVVPAQPDLARYAVYDNAKTENFFKTNRFTVEGSPMQLVDNDFIVTFASYQYAETLPSFLTEEDDSELLIRLDQYSHFTISENMMNSLKKMYQRRAKGTPTRKARKEKEKLDQWKKADESRFDGKQVKNPLDPIDLAEFIFR